MRFRLTLPKSARTLALICAVGAGLVILPALLRVIYLSAWSRDETPENKRFRNAIAAVYHGLAPYQRLEARAEGWLQLYGRKGRLPEDVLFLALDNASISQPDVTPEERQKNRALQMLAGGAPFPREFYTLTLDRLFGAGAKVVGIDVVFRGEKAGDEQFQATLDRYRAGVVIGSNLVTDESSCYLELPSRSLIVSGESTDPRLGFVNYRPEEEDGLVRFATYRTTTLEFAGLPRIPGQPEIWSLPAQMARKAGYESLVPAEHRSRMFRYVMAEDIHRISLHDIFDERLWASPPFNHGALFKDKMVLIGAWGNLVKDTLKTPFEDMPGPQIHLSALASLLHGDYLSDSSLPVDLLAILLAGLLAWLASVGVNDPLRRSALLAALAAGYVAGAFLLFNATGYSLKLLSPNLALLLPGGLGLAWERLAEQEERKRVRRTLERYVSRDVVKEVLDNPQSFLHTLGGERRPISILFSDVRGFTTLTESADAALLVKQLNEYFTEMVRIVFEHHGTLDKFIGDAVMASWGGIAARGEAQDACSAVSAALGMLRQLRRLNADWKARGLLELKIGIGVNHGEAICGHLGSEQKQEFSAIGDAVNLSSRLEGATKEYQVDLLIGENVARLVRHCTTLRTVDLLQVKGKTKPVEVFTVLDEDPPAWLAEYEAGVRHYRARAFVEAEHAFSTAAEAQPEDWLLQEYLRRVRAYQAAPPAPEWDGVYVLTRK